MGGVLSQPITDKRYNQGHGLGLKYGLCSMQGWRSEMEDAHDAQIGLRYGLEDWSYFAVFDGHAGKRAATYAAWNLLEFILRDSQLKLQTKDLPNNVPVEPQIDSKGGVQPNDESDNHKALIQEISSDQKPSATNSTKESLNNDSSDHSSADSPTENLGKDVDKRQPDPSTEDTMPKPEFISLPVAEQLNSVKEAIRSGFLRIDESMRVADDLSGCTAICVFISPTHLFIANCGDSRAVLYDGDNPTFATEDHKPLNPKERKRILNAGGCVSQRINGTLAVSRALGDFEFKKDHDRGPCEQLVSPEPEVTVIERGEKDEFLILACDGIWDVMANRDLCKFVNYKLQVESSVQNVCSSVLDLCLHKGSRDNMSIIIVVFENGPKYSEEKRMEEERSDMALAELARSLCEQHNEWSEFTNFLKSTIRMQHSGPKAGAINLPPGGGLEAKYDMLHKIFEEEQGKLSPDETADQ